jgi:hypothetical protein
MVFAYYKSLSPRQKRIYLQSDRVGAVELPRPGRFHPLVENLAGALLREDRRSTEAICRELLAGMSADLGVAVPRVEVLAARPSRSWGELHGLYTLPAGKSLPLITVWMRTAQRRQVVAFRTFLRTVLHELGHHLDYALLKLADSFHTEGFYKRESSLMLQLAGPGRSRGASGGPRPPGAAGARGPASS